MLDLVFLVLIGLPAVTLVVILIAIARLGD